MRRCDGEADSRSSGTDLLGHEEEAGRQARISRQSTRNYTRETGVVMDHKVDDNLGDSGRELGHEVLVCTIPPREQREATYGVDQLFPKTDTLFTRSPLNFACERLPFLYHVRHGLF